MDVGAIFSRFGVTLWTMTLEAAPWLLLGLLAAGLMKALVPADWMARWLGGRGLGAITRAAIIGTPIPLCSCSVLPAAMQLRRSGASRGATTSFMVATPENGIDSIAITWALLGPVMTVARPVAALISAVIAGVLTEVLTSGEAAKPASEQSAAPEASCCGSSCGDHGEAATQSGESCCAMEPMQRPAARTLGGRLAAGLRYAVTDLLDDIAGWTAAGLLAAAAIAAIVPTEGLTEIGRGLPAMLVMLSVGLPLYICATASTPLAASLLLAGVGPGAVLVLLLTGPATNLGSIMVVRRELGMRATVGYLVGVAGGALACGVALEWALAERGVDVIEQTAVAGEIVPEWLAAGCAAVLVLLAIRPVRRAVGI